MSKLGKISFWTSWRQVQVNTLLIFKHNKNWSASHPGRFPWEKVQLMFIARESVLVQEGVWNFSRKEESLASAEYLTVFLLRSVRSSITLPTELFQLSSFWWKRIHFRRVDFLRHQIEVLNIVGLAQNVEIIWIGENLASVHVPKYILQFYLIPKTEIVSRAIRFL
jgi:hypothetical protein